MEEYFEYRRWDYLPIIGAIRSYRRLEEEREKNPDIKITIPEALTFIAAQGVGIITLTLALSGLEAILVK